MKTLSTATKTRHCLGHQELVNLIRFTFYLGMESSTHLVHLCITLSVAASVHLIAHLEWSTWATSAEKIAICDMERNSYALLVRSRAAISVTQNVKQVRKDMDQFATVNALLAQPSVVLSV